MLDFSLQILIFTLPVQSSLQESVLFLDPDPEGLT